MLTGSRISQHIRDYGHLGLGFGIGFGFCYTRTVQYSSSFMLRPPSISISEKRLNYTCSSSSSSSSVDFGQSVPGCFQPKSASNEIPVVSDCFSQHEGDDEPPSEGLSFLAGGIVALGKFDALHIGHRELASQASKAGIPFLLSFVGMAEVLGWEPRAPVVAKCDRKRVLSSWAPYCGNIVPTEYQIEFSKVRHLTPREFVEKLSNELGVHGVVAGENYRFGYRAAGDASELLRLCEEYNMEAYIIKSVMDQNQDLRNIGSSDSKEKGQVSSTRVRHALAMGDIKYVSELLGRQHRLILMVKDQEWLVSNQYRVSAGKSCMLNLPPKQGLYESCSLFVGSDNVVPCKVTIDATQIYLDLDDIATCNRIVSQDFRFVGIDFGS